MVAGQRAKRATAETMTRFHTDEYVRFLSRVTPENVEQLTYKGTQFLVGEDNPAFEGVFEFCSISAGGSIGMFSFLASPYHPSIQHIPCVPQPLRSAS